MENNKQTKIEKAFLISVDSGMFDAQISMNELEELAKTSGAEIVGTIIQKRPSPEVATFLGKGMLGELSNFCANNEVDLIIADSELSPIQVKNIEDYTDTRVIDRTTLILDIFASRARSSEGKLQVELAQLKYSLPRLTGRGTSMSRLGGGIGTRGPGETKLETDKRHIRLRIKYLRSELDKVEKRRNAMHERRKKNGAMCVAIVGYTNAGKSTLMNRLTDANVLEEDKLFATLDPTARKLNLPNGQQVMLIDTVGLVRRLPHQLVDAFKSTLEEAVWADVILNVCDASSDECDEHIAVTQNLLNELGCADKPIITVLNKCDKASQLKISYYKDAVKISALRGGGIEALLDSIIRSLPQTRKRVKALFPFDKISSSKVIRDGTIHSEKYTENGLLFDVTLDIVDIPKIQEFIIDNELN